MSRNDKDLWKQPGWVVGLAVVGLFLLGGCSGEKIGQTNIDPSLLESNVVQTTTARIVPASTGLATDSPAKSADNEIDDLDPRMVCQRFMELLQSGNRTAAENYLTKKALALTGKAGLALEPIGAPNAPFELSEPVFNDLKNEVAYIDCRILEDDAAGATQLTWILKKQAVSWRISGLMMPAEKAGSLPRMVSLENSHDVEWMKDDVEDDGPEPAID